MAALIEPVNVRAMIRPKMIPETRSTGSRTPVGEAVGSPNAFAADYQPAHASPQPRLNTGRSAAPDRRRPPHDD